MDVKAIITEVQSLGLRVPDAVSGRRVGAGPAEGRTFVVEGVAFTASVGSGYAARSPYRLIPRPAGRWGLVRNGRDLCDVETVADPAYYGGSTRDGVDYRKIALLHGTDCLATTVHQRCLHWRGGSRCAFCATELSLETGATVPLKTPEMLAEVARAAVRQDRVAHMVLTSGTGDPPGSEIRMLARCAAAVKKHTALPIHVQFAPPGDPGLIDVLGDAGVDTVGIHIECFDSDVLSRMAPAKAAIGRDRYEQSWRSAVDRFGAGQVSSFLIAGLGEAPGTVVWGSEFLADMGVYPFVVPLRPIPGSDLGKRMPPDPETMKGIYRSVADILKRKGLHSGLNRAGCVRCGACSALSSYAKKPDRLVCHSVRNEAEKAAAFSLRHAVFVREQGLFSGSDLDEHDPLSTHIVAKVADRVVGTVRIFPNVDPGHWVGDGWPSTRTTGSTTWGPPWSRRPCDR